MPDAAAAMLREALQGGPGIVVTSHAPMDEVLPFGVREVGGAAIPHHPLPTSLSRQSHLCATLYIIYGEN